MFRYDLTSKIGKFEFACIKCNLSFKMTKDLKMLDMLVNQTAEEGGEFRLTQPIREKGDGKIFFLLQ